MTGSLPRRYARALIHLAQGENLLDSFAKGLEDFLKVVSASPAILEALGAETIDAGERLAAMEEVVRRAGFHPLLQNFFGLLVKRERVRLLPEIVREYLRFRDEICGIVRVTVRCPKPPDPPLLQRVEGVLGQRLAKKVMAKGESREEMIGGILLKIDHTVYDGSVRTELERMREAMLKG